MSQRLLVSYLIGVVLLGCICLGGYWVWVIHKNSPRVLVPKRSWLAPYLPQLFEPLSDLDWGTCEQAITMDRFDRPLSNIYQYYGSNQIVDGKLVQTANNTGEMVNEGARPLAWLATRGNISGNFFAQVSVDDSQFRFVSKDQDFQMNLMAGRAPGAMAVIRLSGNLQDNAQTGRRALDYYLVENGKISQISRSHRFIDQVTHLGIKREGKDLAFYFHNGRHWVEIGQVGGTPFDIPLTVGVFTTTSPGLEGGGVYDNLALTCDLIP